MHFFGYKMIHGRKTHTNKSGSKPKPKPIIPTIVQLPSLRKEKNAGWAQNTHDSDDSKIKVKVIRKLEANPGWQQDPRFAVGAWKKSESIPSLAETSQSKDHHDSTWIDDGEMDFSEIPVFEDGLNSTEIFSQSEDLIEIPKKAVSEPIVNKPESKPFVSALGTKSFAKTVQGHNSDAYLHPRNHIIHSETMISDEEPFAADNYKTYLTLNPPQVLQRKLGSLNTPSTSAVNTEMDLINQESTSKDAPLPANPGHIHSFRPETKRKLYYSSTEPPKEPKAKMDKTPAVRLEDFPIRNSDYVVKSSSKHRYLSAERNPSFRRSPSATRRHRSASKEQRSSSTTRERSRENLRRESSQQRIAPGEKSKEALASIQDFDSVMEKIKKLLIQRSEAESTPAAPASNNTHRRSETSTDPYSESQPFRDALESVKPANIKPLDSPILIRLPDSIDSTKKFNFFLPLR